MVDIKSPYVSIGSLIQIKGSTEPKGEEFISCLMASVQKCQVQSCVCRSIFLMKCPTQMLKRSDLSYYIIILCE